MVCESFVPKPTGIVAERKYGKSLKKKDNYITKYNIIKSAISLNFSNFIDVKDNKVYADNQLD